MEGFEVNRGMFSFADTGTGKTTVAMAVIRMFDAKYSKIMIVCPNNVIPTWKNELQRTLVAEMGPDLLPDYDY